MNRNFWIAVLFIAGIGALAGWGMGYRSRQCRANGGILVGAQEGWRCVRGLPVVP